VTQLKRNIFAGIKGILSILLLCFSIYLSAQSDTIHLSVSSSRAEAVDFRIPDKKKIEEYKKDPRFNYQVKEKELSWWDKVKFKIFRAINNLFSSVSYSGVPGVAVIIVIVLVLCLIIMKLFGVNFRTLVGKKKIDDPDIDIYTENVHEMNFDALIANALKNKDYRLVIRFLYLKNLKLLSDKDIITWSANKTNYSYQFEISDNTLRSKFLETTLIFDYVWYGEFPVSEEQFSDIYSRMNNLNTMIK